MHINLLPFDYLQHQLIRRRIVQWACVWIIVAGAMVVVAWIDHAEYAAMSRRLATLKQEYEPVKQLKQETHSLRAQLNDIQRRESIMLQLAVRQPVLTILGAVSQAAHDCDGHVAVTALAVNALRAASREQQHDNLVGIEGIADSDAAISQFASGLRKLGIFQQVSLKKTTDREISGTKVRSYGIDCKY